MRSSPRRHERGSRERRPTAVQATSETPLLKHREPRPEEADVTSIYIYLASVKFNSLRWSPRASNPADRLVGGGIGRPMRKNIAGLKRDIVVHVAVAGAGRDGAARCGGGRTGGPEIRAGIIGPEIAATAAAAAIEHGQRGVEVLQHHFGGVFLDACLIGPFARLQLALDINLGALL